MYRNLDLDLSSGTHECSAICREAAKPMLGLVPLVPEAAEEEAASIMRRLVVEYLEPPRIGS
jgi:hypothetical protein